MSTQTETVLSNGTSQTSTYVPTHPDAIRVEFQDGDYNSYAVASRVSAHSLRQPFQKGDIIATFEHATPSSVVRYSTVQTGDDAHLELNSEYVCQLTPSLLYCNHSCDPSVEFHVDETDLRKGCVGPLTQQCLGTIAGAENLSNDQLAPYFLNDHIARRKAAQATS